MPSATLPSSWRLVKVNDIKGDRADSLATGPFGSSISSKFFQPIGVPVIRGSNLSERVGERLIENDFVFVSEEKAAEFKRAVVRDGDLVFTCWGTIGQIGLIDGRASYPEYIISNKQMKLTPNTREANSLFLYYALSSPAVSHQFTANAIGSSVPGFNLGQLKEIKLPLPPLPEQRAIAGVLGALDDKIEVNRKMARVLEGIARAVFTSWFVDFDPVRRPPNAAEGNPTALPHDPHNLTALFPKRLVDSPVGQVPEGWRVGTLAEHFNLTMGQSPPGSTYNEVGDGLPFYQGRTDYGFRFPTPRVFCTEPTRFAEPGDTLVSVRAPVGDVNMAIERCAVGRGVAAIRHKSGSRSLTYYAMHALRPHFLRFEADGTVFGAIGKTDFERLPFVVPPALLVTKFEGLTGPIDQRIEKCERQSATLANLRDALLPKLISGELRIADAEKIVGRSI